jgi:hypothetical protein
MYTKPKIIKQCATCGGDFVYQDKTQKMFCSRDCWKKKAYLTKPKTVFKKGMKSLNYKGIIYRCVDCDKKIASHYAKRCKSCDVKKRWSNGIYNFPQGEKHPLWRGGRNEKYLRRRFQLDVVPIVLKRDNYTCQICGIRGVELHVDHIQPWAEYIEGRFDISNCRTLCRECHYQITFGKPMPRDCNSWGKSYHNLERKVC